MSRCPRCGGRLTLTPLLRAKPLGSWSLAGAQPKTVATLRFRAECDGCDLSVEGRVEDGELAPDGRTFVRGRFVEERGGRTP